MAEETTEATQEDLATSTPEVPESADAPVEGLPETASETKPTEAEAAPNTVPAAAAAAEPASSNSAPAQVAASTSSESKPPKEPDALQPLIAKVCETIQHEVDDAELDKFLRAHIKTFREEWETMSDTAKHAYLHMMASQLLQRKASTTRIMMYEPFKLPEPSAQTQLFESLKQSQVKPQRCIPVLLMPPNLRPTYSLKK